MSQDIGSSTTGTGTAVIYYYAFQDAITYGRLWDSYSLTPWYRYYTSSWHQCWYDDSVSLDIKFGMVNDSLLQGAGCWALGYDRSYDHIWNAIRRNFWAPGGVSEYNESRQTGITIALVSKGRIELAGFDPALQYRISVYNNVGQRCYERTLRRMNTVVFGDDWQSGVYFIVIEDHTRIHMLKAVLLRTWVDFRN